MAPASDDLGVFLALLDHLRDVRVSAKRLARSAPDADERSHQHALQQTFKILINAFYGYLAFSGGHFNDFAAADRVTAEGRRIVSAIVDRLTALGATPIEADTDGVYFLAPPGHDAEDDAAPAGGDRRRPARGHRAGARRPPRRDALLQDEDLRAARRARPRAAQGLRASARAVWSRSSAGSSRRSCGCCSRASAPRSARVIDRWLAAFAGHQVPVKQFARTETLQDTVDVYRERVQAGLRAPSAAYELVLAAGRVCQPGDQVSYYVAGRSRNVVVNEQARLASEWDPARPDENVEHYQAQGAGDLGALPPLHGDRGPRPLPRRQRRGRRPSCRFSSCLRPVD